MCSLWPEQLRALQRETETQGDSGERVMEVPTAVPDGLPVTGGAEGLPSAQPPGAQLTAGWPLPRTPSHSAARPLNKACQHHWQWALGGRGRAPGARLLRPRSLMSRAQTHRQLAVRGLRGLPTERLRHPLAEPRKGSEPHSGPYSADSSSARGSPGCCRWTRQDSSQCPCPRAWPHSSLHCRGLAAGTA